jgi:hypothetical protein
MTASASTMTSRIPHTFKGSQQQQQPRPLLASRKQRTSLHPYLKKVLNDSISLGHDLWTRDNKELHVFIPYTFRRFSMTASASAMTSGLEKTKKKPESIPLGGSQ